MSSEKDKALSHMRTFARDLDEQRPKEAAAKKSAKKSSQPTKQPKKKATATKQKKKPAPTPKKTKKRKPKPAPIPKKPRVKQEPKIVVPAKPKVKKAAPIKIAAIPKKETTTPAPKVTTQKPKAVTPPPKPIAPKKPKLDLSKLTPIPPKKKVVPKPVAATPAPVPEVNTTQETPTTESWTYEKETAKNYLSHTPAEHETATEQPSEHPPHIAWTPNTETGQNLLEEEYEHPPKIADWPHHKSAPKNYLEHTPTPEEVPELAAHPPQPERHVAWTPNTETGQVLLEEKYEHPPVPEPEPVIEAPIAVEPVPAPIVSPPIPEPVPITPEPEPAPPPVVEPVPVAVPKVEQPPIPPAPVPEVPQPEPVAHIPEPIIETPPEPKPAPVVEAPPTPEQAPSSEPVPPPPPVPPAPEPVPEPTETPRVSIIPDPPSAATSRTAEQYNTNAVALGVVAVLLLLGVGALTIDRMMTVLGTDTTSEPTVVTLPTSIISPLPPVGVSVSTISFNTLTEALNTNPNSAINAEYIITDTAGTPIATDALLHIFDVQAGRNLIQSVETVRFVQVTSDKRALVFVTRDISGARGNMLEWERSMFNDIGALIDSSTASTFDNRFIDSQVQGVDVRVLQDTDGRELIAYAFAKDELVVITRSRAELDILLTIMQ